jgi:hypothetical protein
MKKLVILLIVLGGLIGAAWFLNKPKSTGTSSSAELREFVFPEFTDPGFLNGVTKIVIKEGEQTTELVLQDGKFLMANRAGYPASLDRLNSLMRDLRDLKPRRLETIGASDLGLVGLVKPGSGVEGKAGLSVDWYGEGDKPIKSFVLGETIQTSGGSSGPMGGSERFLKIEGEGDTVWVISDIFSASAETSYWMNRDFFKVEKIRDIQVAHPNPAEGWHVNRENESLEFALASPVGQEFLDTEKASGLQFLLGNPTFNDILGKKADWEGKWNAPITATFNTFDGFTYVVTLALKPGQAPDAPLAEGAPPPEKKYLLSVSVNAKLPEKREPAKDEKPEDKARLDEEFANTLATLKEKLAKEKAYEGWVYEVNDWVINTILKKKSEIVSLPQVPEAPAPEAPAPEAPAPEAPAPEAPAPEAPAPEAPAPEAPAPEAPAPEAPAPEAPAPEAPAPEAPAPDAPAPDAPAPEAPAPEAPAPEAPAPDAPAPDAPQP